MLPLLLAAANFAPLLSKFLNAGETTQKVATEVASIATAVAGTSSPEEALAKIGASEELKQKFILAVNDQAMKWDQMYLDDTKDARDRDVKLAQAGQTNRRANFLTGIAVVVVFSLVTLAVWNTALPEYVKGIVTLVLGRFLGYLDQIYNFEFGTTRSSRDKDATIKHLSQGTE